ncbi:uncharacterized protein PAC_08979 [Phialocephala subalpina]|uniref:F-box domain-containing protein n=1 Tax=Phialocephala subalpina TaxID=576137 RepID=A0A1L7X242_9HELO|nr:uncharacterized protein PAC_08979 [Phialocephala subalpina]
MLLPRNDNTSTHTHQRTNLPFRQTIESNSFKLSGIIMVPTFLPNEIWIDVMKRLPADDLPSVSRTPKLLHQLVEPILHVNFSVMYDHEARGFTALDLSSFTWEDRTAMPYTLLDVVYTHKLSQDLLDRILDTKSWDSVATFLIAIISPGVKIITINNFGASRCLEICSILEVLANQQDLTGDGAPFSQLHEVQLLDSACDKRLRDTILENAPPFPKLESVARFVIQGIKDAPILEAYTTSVFSAPSLELQNCEMMPGSLDQFLRCFKTLRRWKRDPMIRGHHDQPKLNIGRDFPTRRKKLEELIIDDVAFLLTG